MRNTQAWAWLTAGIVALGLNGLYHDGGAAWAHRVSEGISNRADYAIERVSGRAEQLVAVAHFDAMSAREQAQMDRWQAQRDRIQARVQVQVDSQIARQMARVRVARAGMDSVEINPVEIRVACPRVQVNVPAVRIPAVDIPEIQVPRVKISQIPAVRITAPVISGDETDSGPI